MAIQSASRLQALAQTKLMRTSPDECFDRITQLATRVLKVPVSLFTLIDGERQFFKSAQGLPEPLDVVRETALTHSICQYVVDTSDAIVVENAREHPILKNNLAVKELGVGAYLGMPVLTKNGEAVGSLCAIDFNPRTWTKADVLFMRDLSVLIMSEIKVR